jgi:regulator of PEP synthase PpsR (kinase-PPPase family)
MNKRTVFFVSDSTGITAKVTGQSLLTHFPKMDFERRVIPFVDTVEKAREAVGQIDRAAFENGERPIVFSTLVDPEIRETLAQADCLVLDFFEFFLKPLEREFGQPSTQTVGRLTQPHEYNEYHRRIEAINFALAHDDGVSVRDLKDAQVILTGVSRCGKTPTCLYLSMQFSIPAANFPLIPEDLERNRIPETLTPFLGKVHGLTIDPVRLAQIRSQRRPGSTYASVENCRKEVSGAEALMRRHGIPFLDTTHKSVEEIATTIAHGRA